MTPMAIPSRSELLQHFAALSTWAVVTALWVYVVLSSGERYMTLLWPGAGLAALNLGAMLYSLNAGEASRWRRPVFSFQLLCALVLAWLLPLSFLPIYTIIWIAMAPSFLSMRRCWLLLLAIMLAWFVIISVGWGEDGAWITVLLWSTFHVFALLMARNLREAERARDEVQALNRELLATQQLLQQASRQSERTRIARDLHDLLGHHLTALTINLQIAERMSEGEARAKVAESRALARLLLSDVREAVDQLRGDEGVDIGAALELLVSNAPGLEISLQAAPDLHIDNVEVAQAVVRCVQEAITNTLRHANATQCRIHVDRVDDRIVVDVADNGSVRGELTEGNGLKGMRERIEMLCGSLLVERRDRALHLHAEIPLDSR